MIKKSFVDSFFDGWMKKTGTATKVIGEVIKMPGVKEMGTILEGINKLEKDRVPVSHAYPWYSKKITVLDDEEKLVSGIEWGIKRKAFINLGNRLMGGMGVIFIKSSNSKDKKNYVEIEMRARISFKKPHFSEKYKKIYDIWIPSNPNKRDYKDKLLIQIYPKSK